VACGRSVVFSELFGFPPSLELTATILLNSNAMTFSCNMCFHWSLCIYHSILNWHFISKGPTLKFWNLIYPIIAIWSLKKTQPTCKKTQLWFKSEVYIP
jgi:hypothetical protein